MKNALLFISLIVMWSAHASPSDSICTLTGDIRGLGNNRLVFIYSIDTLPSSQHSDTLRAVNGHFIYRASLPHPCYFYVRAITDGPPSEDPHIGNSLTYTSKYKYKIPVMFFVVLGNGNMSINTNIDSLSRAHIDNAPINDTYKYYYNLNTKFYQKDSVWVGFWKAHKKRWKRLSPEETVLKDSILTVRVYRRAEDSIAAYIRSHPSSYAGAYLLPILWRTDSATRQTLCLGLDTSLYKLTAVKVAREWTETPHSKIRIGQSAPDIALPDVLGNTVSLSSFRGKVTLIDFWASWCGPCRTENPHVVFAYRKYHNRGFEVYAVSLDTDKKQWKEAIRKDQLTWTHVSDLAGWKSPAVSTYGVQGVPSDFLLDKEGKVLAIDLRGKALEAALKEYIK